MVCDVFEYIIEQLEHMPKEAQIKYLDEIIYLFGNVRDPLMRQMTNNVLRVLFQDYSSSRHAIHRMASPHDNRFKKYHYPELAYHIDVTEKKQRKSRIAEAQKLLAAIWSLGVQRKNDFNHAEILEPLILDFNVDGQSANHMEIALALLLSNDLNAINLVNERYRLGINAKALQETNRLFNQIASRLASDYSLGAEQYVRQWIYLKLAAGIPAGTVEKLLQEELLPSLSIFEEVQKIFPMMGIETIQPFTEDNSRQVARSVLLSNYFMQGGSPGAVGVEEGSHITKNDGEIRVFPGPHPLLTAILNQYVQLDILPEEYGYHTSIEGELGPDALPLMITSFFMDMSPHLLQPYQQGGEGYLSFFGIHQSYIGATVNPRPGPHKGEIQGTQTNIYDKSVSPGLLQSTGVHPFVSDLGRKGILALGAYAAISENPKREYDGEREMMNGGHGDMDSIHRWHMMRDARRRMTEYMGLNELHEKTLAISEAYSGFRAKLKDFYTGLRIEESERATIISFFKQQQAKFKEKPSEPLKNFFRDLQGVLDETDWTISSEEADLLVGLADKDYFKRGQETPRPLQFEVIKKAVLKLFIALRNPHRHQQYQDFVSQGLKDTQTVYRNLYPVGMSLLEGEVPENFRRVLQDKKITLLQNLFGENQSAALEAARLLRFIPSVDVTKALQQASALKLNTSQGRYYQEEERLSQLSQESLQYLRGASNPVRSEMRMNLEDAAWKTELAIRRQKEDVIIDIGPYQYQIRLTDFEFYNEGLGQNFAIKVIKGFEGDDESLGPNDFPFYRNFILSLANMVNNERIRATKQGPLSSSIFQLSVRVASNEDGLVIKFGPHIIHFRPSDQSHAWYKVALNDFETHEEVDWYPIRSLDQRVLYILGYQFLLPMIFEPGIDKNTREERLAAIPQTSFLDVLNYARSFYSTQQQLAIQPAVLEPGGVTSQAEQEPQPKPVTDSELKDEIKQILDLPGVIILPGKGGKNKVRGEILSRLRKVADQIGNGPFPVNLVNNAFTGSVRLEAGVAEQIANRLNQRFARAEMRKAPTLAHSKEVAKKIVTLFFNPAMANSEEARTVTRNVVETLKVISASEFGKMIRSEATTLLNEIERKQKVPSAVAVNKELAEKAIEWFTGALATRQVKVDLAVAFDTQVNPSLLDALRRMKPRIGLAFFEKEMAKGLDREELEGLTFQFIGNLGLYRPSQALTVQNPEAVPVVNDTLQANYLGTNESLFGVGINKADIEGEPYLEVVEKVVQIVSGLLVAERIKKTSDLKNPAKLQEIKAELLRQLFKEQSLPDIIAFQNGNLIINRSYLRNFIIEYLARAEIRKAA